MKSKMLKQEKGFAGSDALIAVLIIALFSGLIATISYNIYISNASLKRMSQANEYIIDVFEYADKSYYDDITAEKILEYFNGKYYNNQENPKVKMKVAESAEEITTPYIVEINIQKYNEMQGNIDKMDLVQEITITVSYKLSNKEQSITMKHTKTRENLSTPNLPNFNQIQLRNGEKVYPIKKENGFYKVCDRADNLWYDYTSGKWALCIKTNRELSLNEQIDINNLLENEEIYAWIPRYAYDSSNTEIKFLFSNSNRYIIENENGCNTLEDIDNNYTISNYFDENGKKLTGIWVNDKTLEVYQTLNNIYPLEQ